MKEEKILIDNLKINYKIAGFGPAILILHGWGSSSEKWKKVVNSLCQKGFRVIVPDLPGFGESQKPSSPWSLDDFSDFVEKFVSVLNLNKFYLIGHSFGGAIAIKYSLKFPLKIEKLFLVGVACLRKKKIKNKFFFIIAKISKIFSFFYFYLNIKKFFYKIFLSKSDYPYAEGIMKDIYLKIINEDLSDILGQIRVPTIIIWGKKDKIKKIEEAFIINKKIENSKLEIIPNVGHSPYLENPEKLANIINFYLST